MSAPADKKALDQLQKVIDKNLEAGDWVVPILPLSFTPIPDDSSEEILKKIGDKSAPKPK